MVEGLERKELLATFLIQGRLSAIVNADGVSKQEIGSITDHPDDAKLYTSSISDKGWSLAQASAKRDMISIISAATGFGESDTSKPQSYSSLDTKSNTTFESVPSTGTRTITAMIVPEGNEKDGELVDVKVRAGYVLGGVNFSGSATAYVDYTAPTGLTQEMVNRTTTSFETGGKGYWQTKFAEQTKNFTIVEQSFRAKIGETFYITVSAFVSGQTTDGREGGVGFAAASIYLAAQPAVPGTGKGPGETTTNPPTKGGSNTGKTKKPAAKPPVKAKPKPKAPNSKQKGKTGQPGNTAKAHGPTTPRLPKKKKKTKTAPPVTTTPPPATTVPPVITDPGPTTPPVTTNPPPTNPPPVVKNLLAGRWSGGFRIVTGGPVISGGMSYEFRTSDDSQAVAGEFGSTNLILNGSYGPVPLTTAHLVNASFVHDDAAGTWTVTGMLAPDDPTLPPEYAQVFTATVSDGDPDTLTGRFDYPATPPELARGSFELHRVV